MKTKLLTLALLSSLLLCNCATTNPKNDLLLAQNAFLRTVNSLTILRDAGEFDEDEVADISKLIISGDRILDKWTDAVLAGEVVHLSDAFFSILTELIVYKEVSNE